MAAYIEERTLDVTKTPGRTGQVEAITLRRGETGATEIRATIQDHGKAFSVSGYTVKLKALLPDHNYTTIAGSISNSSSGIVSVTVDNTLTAVVGVSAVVYFELTKSGVVLTTDAIPIIVEEDMDLSKGQQSEYRNTIDQMLDELSKAISAANTATTNANNAATKATNAATSANNAASSANTAASSANSAATKANTAATNADTATANAKTATTAANNAATAANNKAAELQKKADDGDFDGATFTPSVNTNGDISWTNDKGRTNPTTRNIKGATFTPSVSTDGVISWTNDKGLANPASRNIKGAKGDKGDKGDPGSVTNLASHDEVGKYYDWYVLGKGTAPVHGEDTKVIDAEEAMERLGEANAVAKEYVDKSASNIDNYISTHDETQKWYDYYKDGGQ